MTIAAPFDPVAGSGSSRPELLVIVASTRPGRSGPLVADWFTEVANAHAGFEVKVADLAELDLPLLDEPNHPRLGDYHHDHTRDWADLVESADAYVIVTPEYDFATPASLMNALQYLAREWAYKPVAFVSYGGISGGLRGVQMTKQVVTTLRMMPIPEAVVLPFFARQIDSASHRFEPGDDSVRSANQMLDELGRWAAALAPLRETQRA
ncbi:MAG TPA: NAD(P)H-dependent oxidoreductase [Gemmatimonadales bacterium]|nr:NAD(P)H-dependent oxidoreductase [Gemmatimonadales bacterium]